MAHLSPYIPHEGLNATRLRQEYSRQVTYSEGQHFATRMNSLFFEASAKTAVGVEDAFKQLVRQVVAEPELFSGDKPKTGKSTAPKASGAGRNQTSGPDMPGTISLDDAEEYAGAGGCSC